MTKPIEHGNLHDGSSAHTPRELVQYWRESAARFKPCEPVGQSIAATMRQCADDLERVLRGMGK